MALMSDTKQTEAGWEAALDAAAEWSVLLQEEPDDEALRLSFDDWKHCDELHAKAWAHLTHVDTLVAGSDKVAFLKTVGPERPAVRGSPRLRAAAASLSAGLAACLVLALITPMVILPLRADHMTATAQERLIRLEDDSTIRLAPSSAVKVNYAHNARQVTLMKGEAYFEVSPDAQRPFQVKAQGTTVTVLGTGFGVRQGQVGTDVAVRHGRVRVEPVNGAARVLTDGQWLRTDTRAHLSTGHMSAASVGSWSERRLVAIDQPLSEVVADVRRYYRGVIIVTDDSLGRVSVTGSYDMRDPATAMDRIVLPHGGVVRHVTPWLMIASSK